MALVIFILKLSLLYFYFFGLATLMKLTAERITLVRKQIEYFEISTCEIALRYSQELVLKLATYSSKIGSRISRAERRSQRHSPMQ